MKCMNHVAVSSAWIFYVGYGMYAYVTSDLPFLAMLAGLWMGLFAPFFLWPTGVAALICLGLMAKTAIMRWRYRWWLFGALMWLYVGLIFFSGMVLASV